MIALCVCAAMGLGACQSDFKTKSQSQQTYFSLQEFFETEAVRLASASVRVDKTIGSNDSSQLIPNYKPDWKKEFSALARCDINKPAWGNSYSIDTSWVGEREYAVRYAAKDKNLTVRNIVIHFSDSEFRSMEIEKLNDNYVYTSSQFLAYYCDSLMTITGDQQVSMGTDLQYNIALRFVR